MLPVSFTKLRIFNKYFCEVSFFSELIKSQFSERVTLFKELDELLCKQNLKP